MHSTEYWIGNSELKNITPADDKWPENFDIFEVLREHEGKILDFGCGKGRLCKAFRPEDYYGYDINSAAIEYCRKEYPEYSFGFRLPYVHAVLCWTVLLHIDDKDIVTMINGLSKIGKKVVVGEIMGRKWRREGNPPVFNREAEEYIEMFKNAGMELVKKRSFPYPRYSHNLTYMVFKCSAR